MLKNLICWSFFLLPFGSGLYFHIGETERKCFIEEIPDETMVRIFMEANQKCSYFVFR